MNLDIAVIGAGPAGLGAGYRLLKPRGKSWRIFEATNRVGGLSSSRLDKNGFTWDLGGHVIFTKDKLFKKVINDALGGSGIKHTRAAFIKIGKRFIPFPLQNNIHRLPARAMRECLEGIERAVKGFGSFRPNNFEEWIQVSLGSGIAEHFMLAYNRKVWAFPLDKMGYRWIDGRVSLPSLAKVREAVKTGRDVVSWGPNAGFIFPLNGGTGGLFENIAEPFKEKISFKHRAVKLDAVAKRIHFANGESVSYKKLITTMPLDHLVKKVIDKPPTEVLKAADALCKNSGWMVGIGIDRKIKTNGRCWVYFPDSRVPFYRVTYFSNYSPNNLPEGGSFSSLLCEVSMGKNRKLTKDDAVRQTIDGLITAGIITKMDKKRIVSVWQERLPYLYPIPTLGRDAALKTINSYLKPNGISSVGRFGAWRYEEGNMDHSFLMGHAAVSGR